MKIISFLRVLSSESLMRIIDLTVLLSEALTKIHIFLRVPSSEALMKKYFLVSFVIGGTNESNFIFGGSVIKALMKVISPF